MAAARNSLPLFITKLYQILETPRLASIIAWSPNGDSFIIFDPMEFSAHVLAAHFKHNNISSFVRQLNKYGFRKLRSETAGTATRAGTSAGAWEFVHKNFRRGREDLLGSITRRTRSTERVGAGEANPEMLYACLQNAVVGISRYFETIMEGLQAIRQHICERGGALHVLVAESSAQSAAFAAHILQQRGCQVITAASMHEVLSLLNTKSFDLLLFSAALPHVGQLLQRARQANAHAMLAVVADEMVPIEEWPMLFPGADRVLLKSYIQEQLLSILESPWHTSAELAHPRCHP